jgi:two-component system, OmpR family, sensor histidine kinase KdpD
MTEPSGHQRGKLKIFLGYAAGVGKTYQMLDEGQQLRAKGADVVIGYFEPHGRQDTIAKSEGLEVIPRRRLHYRGVAFEEMDAAAILRRKPQVCLVDELAHSNVPGSERAKRWQDVRVLREAGIDVLSSLNVQHLESLNDQVWQMTGVRVRETIPDWVVNEADEVVLVDVSPRALRHRLERGVVYPTEKSAQALEHFFTERNLSALRELAMRHTAHEIEDRLATADEGPAAGTSPVTAGPDHPGARRPCILICLDERPVTAILIRRGRLLADYLKADCVAAHVVPDRDWSHVSRADREAVEKHLSFASNLRIETRIVEGYDFASTLVDFARSRHVTQLLMGRSVPSRWARLFGSSKLHRVVRLARDIEITIVAERRPTP